MKNLKKIAGIMLALVMVLAMAVPAFAAETATDPTTAPATGSITITNPAEDETYNVYKMFTLANYDKTTEIYTYEVTPEWKDFVTTGKGKDYFKLVDGVYVTTQDGINNNNAPAIATAALEYVTTVNGNDGNPDNNIAPTATLNKDNGHKATGLGLGYYLVDSSLGTLCGLTTTDADVTIEEKNGKPTVSKFVKVGNDYFETNTASIGDTVEFKTTFNVTTGTENYVLHDIMDETFALQDGTIEVKIGDADVAAENYTLLVAGDATNPTTDTHTFDIQFKNDYIKTVAADTEITVTYKATLKENAKIYTQDTAVSDDQKSNNNETWLTYGANTTVKDSTRTFTYSFDLVKTTEDKTVLPGAQFKIYDAQTGGNEIEVVKVADGQYRVANATEAAANDIAIEAGQAIIKGLGNGTYYLEETTAPDGYNKLTARKEFTINNNNLDATYTDDAKTKYNAGGVQVINYAGGILPSTGGIGTVIFYIVGGILLVGAGVLLVVRKRMNAENKNK